ncbi:JAB domain-containing protein [Clostridium baratii]|uniref:JAB domain-containing protein n=1 Tax=Clostridium baratii TaxID=1561 RepID=UPI002942A03D|nr:JAB domain-containing protein [Clostridium baratii]
MKYKHSKRIDIVSLKMVKEKSIFYGNRSISSVNDAVELLKGFFYEADREMLLVCCLNTKNEPNCINTVSIGTLTSSLVHPREVFKASIMSNSASIILAHNHPSGNSIPSEEDLKITRRIKEAGEILGIRLLDHIIIGDNNYKSLKERGVI